MIFALVGNQNCGKTTLFNALTGSNQHVGNFPGVTVDQKMGAIKGAKDSSVVDLPGIYSLRPYTQEEIVSRDFILNQKPDGIINIVDATNIERNLYLTLQLLELRVPMVLALQYDGRGALERRHNRCQEDERRARYSRCADKRGKGRGCVRACRSGSTGCKEQNPAESLGLLLRRFARPPMHPRYSASYRRPLLAP